MEKKRSLLGKADRLKAKRMMEFRKQVDISTNAVARLLGVTSKTIERWEAAEYKCKMLSELAHIYGREITDWDAPSPGPFDMRRVAPFYLRIHPKVNISSEEIDAALEVVERMNETHIENQLNLTPKKHERHQPHNS